MSNKTKALGAWATISLLTLLLYALGDLAAYPSRALPLIWAFFSWNFLAYGFDRGMWPRGFVQLDGHGQGHPFAREVVFWATAGVYLLILATIAWGE